MKPGTRVVKAGSPGVFGTVTGIEGGAVRVRWSEHFEQLVSPRKLIQVTQLPASLGRYLEEENTR